MTVGYECLVDAGTASDPAVNCGAKRLHLIGACPGSPG